MKLYKTHVVDAQVLLESRKPIWTGSASSASKERTTMMKTFGLRRDQVKTDMIDIDIRKEGLIAFLNAS